MKMIITIIKLTNNNNNNNSKKLFIPNLVEKK